MEETTGRRMLEASVVGQRRVTAAIKRLLQGGRIPHCLLFYGPEGTGKAAAALELARALHCDLGEAGACGGCRGCRKTAGLNHPDFSLLFPLSARTSQDAEREALLRAIREPYGCPSPEETAIISVSRIRDLQGRFSYGTYEGKWRTAVILYADRMRPEAANALLKTLEEPPDRSLIILAARGPEVLLPTVVSRCQALKFSPLSSREVAQTLIAQMGLDAGRARFVAGMCRGNLRLAREMAAADVDDVQDRAYRFLEALIWGEEPKTYAALENLSADRRAALQVLGGAEIWLRDVLIWLNGDEDRVLQRARLQDVRRLAGAFDLERLSRTAEKIEMVREMNHRNVNLHMGLVSLWRQVRQYADPPPVR